VGDGLVGADRAAELLAVLGVLDGHLHRALGDPGRLGGEGDAEAEEDREVVGPLGGQRVLGGDLDAVEAHRVQAPGEVDRGGRRDRDPGRVALDQVAAPVRCGDHEEVRCCRVHNQDLFPVENDAVAVSTSLHLEAADGRRRAGIP
jgi:hypothetical protein